MSQLTIQLSDRADALVAQLQKEIFNRRRKKVSPVAVIETLVESGARSQSDKRFATSWANLIADIEKAAKMADAHGAKPASLSDEEWVMVLSHRTRQATTAASAAPARRLRSASGPGSKADTLKPAKAGKATKTIKAAKATKLVKDPAVKTTAPQAASGRRSAAKASPATSTAPADAALAAEAPTQTPKPGSRRRTSATSSTPRSRSKAAKPPAEGSRRQAPRTSVARRMAKAVSRLSSQASAASASAPQLVAEPLSTNGVLTTA